MAFRNEILANAGAYPAMAAFLPTFTRMMAAGTYDIERIETSAVAVVTNTTPIEAFRGAGRPEATAVEPMTAWPDAIRLAAPSSSTPQTGAAD